MCKFTLAKRQNFSALLFCCNFFMDNQQNFIIQLNSAFVEATKKFISVLLESKIKRQHTVQYILNTVYSIRIKHILHGYSILFYCATQNSRSPETGAVFFFKFWFAHVFFYFQALHRQRLSKVCTWDQTE